jgi:hypothetical protein
MPKKEKGGVADGTRTRDNRYHKPGLYQLSYGHHPHRSPHRKSGAAEDREIRTRDRGLPVEKTKQKWHQSQMPDVPENWKPVAFKEWQVVCDALESGEQTVILRKGGISEGKLGFQWLHDRFFLFPTQFHEQAEQVRREPDEQLRAFDSPDAEDEGIEFRLFAEAVEMGRLTDWQAIQELAGEHIWTEEVIRERYEWGDEPGISFARVRIWRLAEPWILANRKSFGGCRSWIGLPADESGSVSVAERIAGAGEIGS